jgi:hypothetical protein
LCFVFCVGTRVRGVRYKLRYIAAYGKSDFPFSSICFCKRPST